MTPEDYANLLNLMTEDVDMQWHEMSQVMCHLKQFVEFEDENE